MSVAPFARAVALIGAIFVVIVGVVHVASSFDEWCHDAVDPNQECFGPYLFWNSDDTVQDRSFTYDSNRNGWRTVFSLVPAVFFDLWTPLFFGLLALSLHFKSFRFEMFVRNWARVCVFYLFLALWCSFGYAGNLGIIAGLICSFAAFLALVCAFGDEATYYAFDY